MTEAKPSPRGMGWFMRALATASDGDAAAESVAHGPLRSLAPAALLIYRIDPDLRALDRLGQWGLDHDVAASYASVPLESRSIAAHAFRSGDEVVMSLHAIWQEYPLSNFFLPASRYDATSECAFLPLRRRSIPIGVLGVVTPHPIERSWEVREQLDIAIGALSLWLDAFALRSSTDLGMPRAGPFELTDRQRDIIVMARDGCTNREIAEGLGFSEVTIKADLTRLYRLFGAADRVDLLHRAARAGI